MAITDNNFTADEFAAVLTAKPELQQAVKQVLTGGTFNYVVQNADEHNAFKTNFENTIVSKKTSEFATQLEKDIFELTGIEKKPHEKYYDYQKRAFSDKLGSVNALQAELTALKNSPNQSAADKLRITQLEQGIATEKANAQKLLKEKDTELLKTKASFLIEKDLASIRVNYKKNIPDDLLQLAEQTAVNKLVASARFADDGSLTFVNEKGELIQNAEYKAKTAKEFLLESLKTILEEKRQQQGAGGKQGAPTDPQKGAFVSVPADVKTKTQLTEYLFKLGYTDDKPEFTAIMAEHGKNLPLR